MHVQYFVCFYSLPGWVAVSTLIKLTLPYKCYLLVSQGLWVLNAVVCALDTFDPFMFADHFLWDG